MIARRPVTLALLTLATLSAGACRSGGAFAREVRDGEVDALAAGKPVLVLRVRNESLTEQVVYLQTGTDRRRIGSVVGSGGTTFIVPRERLAPGQLIALFATPIGQGRTTNPLDQQFVSRSGQLNAGPGNTVEFTIGAAPAQSRAVIR